MKNKSIYPWVVVGLLWIVALLNYMDRQMLSTMQEAMKVDIVELNKAEAFGALMAIFLWIYGFMSPIAGMIADAAGGAILGAFGGRATAYVNSCILSLPVFMG